MKNYNLNMFKLTKKDPIKVHTYKVKIEPRPNKAPLFYQILGIVAKDITKDTKNMVISDMGLIKVYYDKLSEENHLHKVTIPNKGEYEIQLYYENTKNSTIEDEEEYSKFINRLFDLYLLYYSDEFRKYHPNAPMILKYEPTFDKSLIENTGIWDVKEYYRGIRRIGNDYYLIIDRNTILTSHKNLLVELQAAKERYQRMKGGDLIDFYDPPSGFVSYINSIYIGKPAYVREYPGPRVNRISQITWEYRCSDVTPGNSNSICSYFLENYGIKDLDAKQPLVKYQVEDREGEIREQYHVPELLIVNHDFRDLRMIISSWQRAQVWDYIHPNCKNQLREIYSLMKSVDDGLKEKLPDIYGKIIKFDPIPESLNKFVLKIPTIGISFENKQLELETPYSEKFYRSYSDTTKYHKKIDRDIEVLVHCDKKIEGVDDFLLKLNDEFYRRNNNKLIFKEEKINFEEKNYLDYDLVITISDDEEIYIKCKEIIQNIDGVLHQNIKTNSISKEIFVPLVLQITLELGGVPWILNTSKNRDIIGIYSYKSKRDDKIYYYYNVFDNEGSFIKQSKPYELSDSIRFLESLVENIKNDEACIISYYDRHNLLSQLEQLMEQDNNKKYIILHIKEKNNLRFFETWKPTRSTPRRRRSNIPVYPFESYEGAPQGLISKFSDSEYYIITSKSVERKDETFRGCPNPITIEVFKNSGMNIEEIMEYVLKLSFMTKTSGHMNRLPAPIEYLKTYASHNEKFGFPENEEIQNKLYYL